MQIHEDVPYRTSGLNVDGVFTAWSRITDRTGDAFIHRDRLARLCDTIRKRPLAPADDLIKAGTYNTSADEYNRAIIEAQSIKRDKKFRYLKTKSTNDAKSEELNRRATEKDTLKDLRRELQASLDKLKELDAAVPSDEERVNFEPSEWRATLEDSPLIRQNAMASARVRRSASSKLNWIIHEVRVRLARLAAGVDLSWCTNRC